MVKYHRYDRPAKGRSWCSYCNGYHDSDSQLLIDHAKTVVRITRAELNGIIENVQKARKLKRRLGR